MRLHTAMIQDCLERAEPDKPVVPFVSEDRLYNRIDLLQAEAGPMEENCVYVGSVDALPRLKEAPVSQALFLLSSGADWTPPDGGVGPLQALILPGRAVAQILQQVCQEQNRLNQWDISLTEALAEGKSLQDLVDLSEMILDDPVLILDTSLRVLAYSRDIPEDDESFRATIHLGYTPPNMLNRLYRAPGWPERFQSEIWIASGRERLGEFDELHVYVKVEGRVAAGITLHCIKKPASIGRAQLLAHFAEKLSLYFRTRGAETQPADGGNFSYEQYFRALLEGRPFAPEEAFEISDALHFPFDAEFRLFVLDELGQFPPEYALRQVLETLPEARCILYEGRVVGVTAFKSKYREETEHGQLLRQALNYLIDHMQCACGMSSSMESQLDLHTAYLQASSAIRIGDRLYASRNPFNSFHLSSRPRTRLFFYDELYLHHMVELSGKQMPLASVCHPRLREMMESDRKNQTDNYKVLYAYLETNQKTTEAAKVLHMHRNNVNYRIKRIESLFHLDLEDPATRLRLQVSFRILDMM